MADFSAAHAQPLFVDLAQLVAVVKVHVLSLRFGVISRNLEAMQKHNEAKVDHIIDLKVRFKAQRECHSESRHRNSMDKPCTWTNSIVHDVFLTGA